MKKLSLVLSVALFAGMGMTSCKKCMTCTYEVHEEHDDHEHHDLVILPEVCDTKGNLDDAEDAYRLQFEQLSDAEDFRCERD